MSGGRARSRPVGGSVLLGLVVVLALTGLLLAPVTFSGAQDEVAFIHPGFFLPDLFLGVAFGGFGSYVVLRAGHPVGWALGAVGVGFLVSAAAIQWVLASVEHPQLPGGLMAVSLVVSGWCTGTLVALLVLPWLITPDRPSTASVVGASLGAAAAVTAGTIRLLQYPLGGPREHAVSSPGLAEATARVAQWDVVLLALVALVVAGLLAWRRRHAPHGQRRASQWVLGAEALVAVALLLFDLGLRRDGAALLGATVLLVIAMVMLAAAVFALVVRDLSVSVDLAVTRLIVGALLAGLALASYAALAWLLRGVLGWTAESAALTAVAVLVLLAAPVRRWLQGRVGDLVFGHPADVSQLLVDLGRAVATGRPDGGQLDSLVGALRRALHLQWVAVIPETGPTVVAGEPGRAHHTVPLLNRGRSVGVLAVAVRPGRRLDPRMVQVLQEISGLVAIAVELSAANSALEGARRRLLDVRQEERRLLRRELHDGLGPSLSGAALALAAIGNTSTLRPGDATLLAQIRVELERRADDVRQMARVLLPPALEMGRLDHALAELATRFSDDRFAVTVAVDGHEGLTSDHQVAAYHIAAEGVRNASRHAGATTCAVRIGPHDDGGLLVEVVDNGSGLDPAAAPGVGLSSMRERATELGGRFSIASDAGGARVTVVLP